MINYTPTYTPFLVVLSIAIAIVASYTALTLAGRVTVARGGARRLWLAGGAVALGIGIWSMHFVGMLACQLPFQMSYNVPLVVVSAGVAVIAAALALRVVSQDVLGAGTLIRGGLTMGAAIAGMHYIGMAAMRMDAQITYRPLIFALSIVIAVSASVAALWLAFHFRTADTWTGGLWKCGSALIMGIAIAGMHYTGMAAARFTALPGSHSPPMPQTMDHMYGTGLAMTVAAVSAMILLVAIVCAAADRRIVRHEQERLRQHNAELELRVAELHAALAAAEVANRTKTEFLARMSHELRTPLNAVIGFANILTKNKAGNLRPQDMLYLQRITDNGCHLLSIINDILELSEIEAGRMEVAAIPTALETVVYDVVEQFAPMAKGRPISMETEIPSVITAVDTDAEKVRQVLTNLVDNALKFTEQGTVTVRLVTNPDTGRPQRIEVTDTGIGIPDNTLSTLFTPFEQGDNTMTRRFGGTGLGLAISRSLCVLLGYTLTVASLQGRGTTITIGIPADILTGKSRNEVSSGERSEAGPTPRGREAATLSAQTASR